MSSRSRTPSKVGALQHSCLLCGFSFEEAFVNEKGKIVSGRTRKRLLPDATKLAFYLPPTDPPTEFECPTAVCVPCLSLLDKGIKANETYNAVRESVREKLARIPRKRVLTFTPVKLDAPAKRPAPRPTASTTTTVFPTSPWSHRKPLSTSVTVKQTICLSPMKEVLASLTGLEKPEEPVSIKPKSKAKRSLVLQEAPDTGQPPTVEVTLTYSSRVIHREVRDRPLQDIVKAVVLNQIRTASKHIADVDLQGILQEICVTTEKEVKVLTSGKLNSLLRRTTREDFASFSFQELFKELKDNAPCLMQLVCSVMNINVHCPTDTQMAQVCCSVAPMLKTRNREMSAVAYLTAFVLKHGGCKQPDFMRIARMGYSVMPQTVNRKLKTIAETTEADYEELLNAWKHNAQVVKVVNTLRDILHARNMIFTKPVLNALISANLLEVKMSNPFTGDVHTLTELISCGFPLDITSCNYTFQVEETLTYLNSRYLDSRENMTKGISMAGDNWDKRIIPTYVTSEAQGQDMHLFMLVLLVDRLPVATHLEADKPQCDAGDLQNDTFLPTEAEQVLLKSELSFIVGKTGVTHIPALKNLFGKTMPKVYPHVYLQEMSQKSEQYVLGLFDINETKTKDMIKLLKLISEKFVPTFVSSTDKVEVAEPVFFGGDQLTDERAQGAKRAMSDATTSVKRLEGIIPKTEDFHRGMNFFEAIHKLTYDKAISSTVGTVNYFRNLLRYKTVTNDVKSSYRPNRNLYYLINDAQICVHLISHINMGDIDDEIDLPDEWEDWNEDDRLLWYQDVCLSVVEKHFFDGKTDVVDDVRQVLQDRVALENFWQVQLTNENRYKCHHCRKSYVHLNSIIAHEEKAHATKAPKKTQTKPCKPKEDSDEVGDYLSTLFKLTLLHRNLESATDAGDGPRSTRSAKYEMLVYSRTHKIKYLIACIQLHTLLHAKLSQQQAFRLTWNRTVNTRGGVMNNEAIDGWIELVNREVKNMCKGNQSKESCMRHAAAYEVESGIVLHLDHLLKRRQKKGIHKEPQRKTDVRKVVEELLPLFPTGIQDRPLRSHKLRNLGSNIFAKTQSNLPNMITDHKLSVFHVLQ